MATGDDLFRFSVLPAGSCWDNTRCYSDDDALFFIGGEDLDGFSVAFDENDIGSKRAFSHASIRCIKSESGLVEIDPMPESVVIKGIEITSDDLTHGGSDVFAEYDMFYACPEGWRLPTIQEMNLIGVSLPTNGKNLDEPIYASDGSCYVSCSKNSCGPVCPSPSFSPRSGHVRCVKE